MTKPTPVQRKVALYGRVSSVRQAMVQDGGLDTQFDLMERQVELWNSAKPEDWRVVDRYREEGKSGKNLDRPEFKRLMADMEAGRVDTVVVQKIDRITRSLRDFYVLWETFQQHGVSFVSLHENFDTTSAVGRAMLKLILVFAELEREQTGERTKATLEYRATQGLWGSGRPPRGYRRHEEESGVLVVDPAEAEVVRDMFQRVLELGSAQALVRELNERGIRQPEFTNRQGEPRGGGRYVANVICRLLTNPVYLGKIRFNDQLFEGRHPALISEQQFDAVGALLERNRVRCRSPRSQKEHVFLLEGKLRCGECGSTMTPIWSTGSNKLRYHYYACTLRQRTSATACGAKHVPAEEVERLVLESLRTLALSEDEVDRVVERANGGRSAEQERTQQELKELRRKRVGVQQKVDHVLQAIEQGAAFSNSLQTRLGDLEAELAGFEGREAELEARLQELGEVTVRREEVAGTYRDFPDMWDRLTAEGDRHDLRGLLQRLFTTASWTWEEPTAATLDVGLVWAPGTEERPPRFRSGRSLELPGLDSNQRPSG